jgi:glycosyltransferase involved in cell wall biosynthesis
MASQCLVLGSDTAPLREVIASGRNGLLNDFFDVGALSAAMIEACREPGRFAPLRRAARQTIVDKYDRATVCEPAWLRLVQLQLEQR